MKTKLTALILTLCVLLSSLAAVTASASGVAELPDDWKTNVIKATPDMYPDTDLSKPYTVKIYQVGDKPVDWDKIQNALNEQLAPFNTSIDTIFMSWADVSTMYSLNLAGGADIDLIFTAPWEYMFTEAAKGSFFEMDEEFIAKYMPLANKYQPKESWAETKLNGKNIAVPCGRMAPEGRLVGIRTDLAEKYGIGELKNWDDFENFLLTIAEKETPESGILAFGGQENNTAFWELWYTNENWFDAYYTNNLRFSYAYEGKIPAAEEIKLAWETDLFRTFCREMKKLADAGVWSRSALNETVNEWQAFGAGKSASIEWNGTVFTYMKEVEKNEGVTTAAYDLFKEKGTLVTAEAYSNGDIAIAAGCANPERAAMVLDLLKFDTAMNHTVVLGIEGDHYTIDENRIYTRTDNAANYLPDGNSLSWATRNGDVEEAGVPEREKVVYDEWKRRMTANPLTAFIFDPTPVQANADAVDSIIGDYYGMLGLGLVDDPDATLDEMLQKCYNAGLQDIYDEMYRQYNEWVAAR
jgi:putative aldouronate transport system substrate-binding protein